MNTEVSAAVLSVICHAAADVCGQKCDDDDDDKKRLRDGGVLG